ncbi:MAG TPA: DUF4267 domain-containing protein [Beutenbergiaceae bacterium]|nr:DUF4267 domain-containing protein [Beutenbergiaceae bacterium]
MEITGLVLAGLAGLAIAVIGVLYLVRPRLIAASFGLPVPTEPEATPWLRLKGARDLTTGIAAGVLLWAATPSVVGWAVLAFTVIPIADAAIILGARHGNSRAAWGVHGSTAALMVVAALMLLLN